MAAQIGASAAAARAHEELYSYWSSLKHGSRLPGRGDIDPGDFKRLLPTVSLIDVTREPLDFRIRLAGTGLYGVYGREITGRTLDEVYNTAAAEYWRGELTKVIESRKPAVGVHNLAWRGAGHLSVLWMRLPLASNGSDVDMILGYDAVIGLHGGVSGIRAA
ncbi:MAG: PAS domain-containing protein [Phenylobacterium sp.]|uniref:motility/cell cycle regulatory protein MopJ n=1 Tax=Phenylobacterium sp. TaxID=1871053 RepID=UPI00391A822F